MYSDHGMPSENVVGHSFAPVCILSFNPNGTLADD